MYLYSTFLYKNHETFYIPTNFSNWNIIIKWLKQLNYSSALTVCPWNQ